MCPLPRVAAPCTSVILEPPRMPSAEGGAWGLRPHLHKASSQSVRCGGDGARTGPAPGSCCPGDAGAGSMLCPSSLIQLWLWVAGHWLLLSAGAGVGEAAALAAPAVVFGAAGLSGWAVSSCCMVRMAVSVRHNSGPAGGGGRSTPRSRSCSRSAPTLPPLSITHRGRGGIGAGAKCTGLCTKVPSEALCSRIALCRVSVCVFTNADREDQAEGRGGWAYALRLVAHGEASP